MPGATTSTVPRATTSTELWHGAVLFYAYVLESLKDGQRYIGFTTDLRRRLEEHQKGLSTATKSRLPIKLIYFEACTNKDDATRREEYLKTTRGRRFLAKRLKSYYKLKL